MMHTLSLCTGIGGFELALKQPSKWIAEIDERCNMVLADRFPDSVNLGDWTQLPTLDLLPGDAAPELVMGGLPCQPVSILGRKQAGNDPRWLYDALAELLRNSTVRPVLFLENVSSITYKRMVPWLNCWRRDLKDLDYKISETRVSAADVGAPHKRLRWWQLAVHPDNDLTSQIVTDSSCLIAAPPKTLLPTLTYQQNKSGNRAYGRTLVEVLMGDRVRGFVDVPQILDDSGEVQDWGNFAPIIDRWSTIIDRRPPTRVRAWSTHTNAHADSISPEFAEWMMGYPADWTTAVTRAERSRTQIIGNSICPRQGTAALHQLVNIHQTNTDDVMYRLGGELYR